MSPASVEDAGIPPTIASMFQYRIRDGPLPVPKPGDGSAFGLQNVGEYVEQVSRHPGDDLDSPLASLA